MHPCLSAASYLVALLARVKRIPSPIPERPWYLQPWALVLAGGALPFGSMLIELHFIFSSLWSYKIYYVSLALTPYIG